tara:strand:- start:756 stop:1250 length:495 start_codon:yes stop_codon:yes gene_type:complete
MDPNLIGASLSLYSPTLIESSTQKVVEAIREKVEAGETDPTELQRRLTERFGAKAEGVVINDGGIDYVKLENVVNEFRAAIEERLRDRLGNSAQLAEGTTNKKKVVQGAVDDVPPIPDIPKVESVIPEPPKPPEPHGIRQFVDKILDELIGNDLDSGNVVNLKT